MRQKFTMSLTPHGKAPNGDPRAVLQLKGAGESTTVGELLRVTSKGAWFARLSAACRRHTHIEISNPITAEAASLVGLFNIQRVVVSSRAEGFFIAWPTPLIYAGRGSPETYPKSWFKNAPAAAVESAPERPQHDVGAAKDALRAALISLQDCGVEVIVDRRTIVFREVREQKEYLPPRKGPLG